MGKILTNSVVFPLPIVFKDGIFVKLIRTLLLIRTLFYIVITIM